MTIGVGPRAVNRLELGQISRAGERASIRLIKPHGRTPTYHRVVNRGTTPFEVIDIEFLKRPDGPSTASIAPPAAENPSARAFKWALAPGASTPLHTHERPYLIIAATPMQLSMKSPDGASMDHPVKAGDLHWIDSKVTHALRNSGTEAGVIVEVELK